MSLINPFLRHIWDDDVLGMPVRTTNPTATRTAHQFSPSVDVVEEQNGFKITAELPGMTKADININVVDDFLIISGEKKEEKKEEDEEHRYKRIERVYGSFSRQFRLPDNVDRTGISACFNDGVLQLCLRKTEPQERKSTNIPIQ